MSPKLPVVTGKEAARVAQRLGFELRRQRGSHAVYVRPGDGSRVVMHAGTELKRKTRQAALVESSWNWTF